jgi:uncharacterized phage protein (TIGR02220 family)
MKSIVIPIEFLKAIGEKPPVIRIYWIKWLSEYTDELLRPDFITFFMESMQDKKLDYGTIKEAYEFGIVFFKDGFTFVEENKGKKRKVVKLSDTDSEQVRLVLDYLNQQTGATYGMTKTNVECITARMKEGYSVNEFKTVIDRKCRQWLGTEQEKYLRPITLFQASKFENYLNEPETNTKKDERKQTGGSISKLSNATAKAKNLFT